MAATIPQPILDSLTDVPMPRLPPEPAPARLIKVGGHLIPVWSTACAIVGSGAAGLRAAVELQRRGVGALVISQSAWGGTSACSGSDKQTLHTANTADQGDDYRAMARAIAAGGAMDGDTAYVEAVGSARSMASLQYLGLPLPQDRFGGTLRYQTDHDEVGRATSCGPRTSRLMVKVLAEEAFRLRVPFLNHTTAVRILADGGVQGLLVIRARGQTPDNPHGLALIRCPTLILAAGGPGELFRDSVYPNGCFGALGLALQAGIAAVNLTEHQFGIGTRREGFPWNLSGTYVQAIPHIYSQDADGQQHDFLGPYFPTTQGLASALFRKGYQWPFHASRMLDFGSSLIDLAIWREGAAGRRVFMDFNRNPVAVPGGRPFALDQLDADAGGYLARTGAVQALPIDRLAHMNPLSIELYRRYKVDIAAQPLEFAVNHQHMNGGIDVDIWGQSSLPGCYAVGEAAGTHGVTRPGGAALNAGQVFGTRAAEHIASLQLAAPAPVEPPGLAADVDSLLAMIRPDSAITPETLRTDVQSRMSVAAGMLCTADGVAAALAQARALNAAIGRQGIAPGRAGGLTRAVQRQQMALLSEAVLTALHHYIAQGGGSRGARAICDSQGDCVPHCAAGPLTAFRFRRERVEDRTSQIVVRYTGGEFHLTARPNRVFDEAARPVFERDWPAWLTQRIHRAEGGHHDPA